MKKGAPQETKKANDVPEWQRKLLEKIQTKTSSPSPSLPLKTEPPKPEKKPEWIQKLESKKKTEVEHPKEHVSPIPEPKIPKTSSTSPIPIKTRSPTPITPKITPQVDQKPEPIVEIEKPKIVQDAVKPVEPLHEKTIPGEHSEPIDVMMKDENLPSVNEPMIKSKSVLGGSIPELNVEIVVRVLPEKSLVVSIPEIADVKPVMDNVELTVSPLVATAKGFEQSPPEPTITVHPPHNHVQISKLKSFSKKEHEPEVPIQRKKSPSFIERIKSLSPRRESEKSDNYPKELKDLEKPQDHTDMHRSQSEITPQHAPLIEKTNNKVSTVEEHICVGLFGHEGVGKTTMILHYLHGFLKDKIKDDRDSDNPFANIFETRKFIGNQDYIETNLSIINSSGKEEDAKLMPQQLQHSEGVMLVFSVEDRYSFEKAKSVYRKIKLNSRTFVPVILVANKLDTALREVTKSEAMRFCADVDCKYFEVSAKDGKGIDQAFEGIILKVREKKSSEIPKIEPPPETKSILKSPIASFKGKTAPGSKKKSCKVQ